MGDYCPHLLTTAYQETACGISGATMFPEDCETCRPDCIPWLGLQVALRKVRLQDLPSKAQDPVCQAFLQAADPGRLPASIEREEAAVALGTSPGPVVQERASKAARARTRAKRSAAAKALWAALPPEEKAARVGRMREGMRRKRCRPGP